MLAAVPYFTAAVTVLPVIAGAGAAILRRGR